MNQIVKKAADAARNAYFGEGRHGRVKFDQIDSAAQDNWFKVALAVIDTLMEETAGSAGHVIVDKAITEARKDQIDLKNPVIAADARNAAVRYITALEAIVFGTKAAFDANLDAVLMVGRECVGVCTTGDQRIEELRNIVFRGINTMEGAPEWAHELCDQIARRGA